MSGLEKVSAGTTESVLNLRSPPCRRQLAHKHKTSTVDTLQIMSACLRGQEYELREWYDGTIILTSAQIRQATRWT